MLNEYNNVPIDSVMLDGNDIIKFEWSGKMNDLVLHGKIHYIDKYGRCDKFIAQQYTLCMVDFMQLDFKSDSDINIEKPIPGQQLRHVFIVDNVKILNRERHQIEYEFSLTSFNWIKLSAKIWFSNFNSPKESIFEIIKKCLVMNQLQYDKDSFDNIKTEVKINYITNANDDVFSVVKYLLNRLYYYDVKDQSFRVLNYNAYNDKYYLTDISKLNKGFGTKQVIVQFFSSSTENLTQMDYTNFATVVKMPKTDFYKKTFANSIYDYSYDYNDLIQNDISSCNIVDFFNNLTEDNKENNIFKKFNSFKYNTLKYQTSNTYWNNQLQVYNDCIQMILENNSLIVNVVGEISVKPGTLVTIAIDKTLLYSKAGDTENKNQLQESANKFSAFEGTWIAVAVQHIVKPNVPYYSQNITLFRPFVTIKENLKTL